MRFLTIPSNYRSTLTHSYFDTNTTWFPYWKSGSRGQLVFDTQSTCANFAVHPIDPSQITKS